MFWFKYLLNMRISSWEEFAERAKKMYLDEPMRTRYIVTYKHAKGKFCVKVTDDFKVRPLDCLQSLMCSHTVFRTCISPCSASSSRVIKFLMQRN